MREREERHNNWELEGSVLEPLKYEEKQNNAIALQQCTVLYGS